MSVIPYVLNLCCLDVELYDTNRGLCKTILYQASFLRLEHRYITISRWFDVVRVSRLRGTSSRYRYCRGASRRALPAGGGTGGRAFLVGFVCSQSAVESTKNRPMGYRSTKNRPVGYSHHLTFRLFKNINHHSSRTLSHNHLILVPHRRNWEWPEKLTKLFDVTGETLLQLLKEMRRIEEEEIKYNRNTSTGHLRL